VMASTGVIVLFESGADPANSGGQCIDHGLLPQRILLRKVNLNGSCRWP
jgi:hypothetical protein